jgi:ribonuclease BN (tRNA processing enzyme)
LFRPPPARSSPAFWLQTSAGTILLDMGADASHRMAQEQLNWPELDAIWISHFHLDHSAGLAPFLFSIKWAPQTQNRAKPLSVFGPRGLVDVVHKIDEANNFWLFEQPFEVRIREVESDVEFEMLPNVSARTLTTPHTKESLALKLKDEDGSSLVYTSDTGISKELIPFSKGVAVLLMESSFRRNKPVQTHLELLEAMDIAAACEPGRLVLTHLYPEWDRFDLVREAKQLWPGITIEATDGLRLEI